MIEVLFAFYRLEDIRLRLGDTTLRLGDKLGDTTLQLGDKLGDTTLRLGDRLGDKAIFQESTSLHRFRLPLILSELRR